MVLSQRLRLSLRALASVLLLHSGTSAAFFYAGPGNVAVVEFYNYVLGHYFLTADSYEIADIEAGSAGPGWVRTGYQFTADRSHDSHCAPTCSVPVYRFHGTPGLGPNSHFYTADAAEAEFLQRPGSGWSFEKIAFNIPMPDAQGRCAGGLVAVQRFYNDRWRHNDSNHRYTTADESRERMAARGWIAEGARFCAYEVFDLPLLSFKVVTPPAGKVLPSSTCEDEDSNLGGCVALNNHEVPHQYFVYPQPWTEPPPRPFFERTGLDATHVYTMAVQSPEEMARRSFVQFAGDGSVFGLHVDTVDRGEAVYTSLNPLFQFTTRAPSASSQDFRFFPFRGGFDTDVELRLAFTLNVKAVETADGGSHAYGHPTIELIDAASGLHLYFTVATYGTVAPSDYLARDVVSGKVIAGTTFRADPAYGRSLATSFLPTPPGFVSPNFLGSGGPFDFRLGREDFRRVIDAARTLEPRFSPSPGDYFVDNFHFNNEVVGDGRIGLNLTGYRLELIRAQK